MNGSKSWNAMHSFLAFDMLRRPSLVGRPFWLAFKAGCNHLTKETRWRRWSSQVMPTIIISRQFWEFKVDLWDQKWPILKNWHFWDQYSVMSWQHWIGGGAVLHNRQAKFISCISKWSFEMLSTTGTIMMLASNLKILWKRHSSSFLLKMATLKHACTK